MNIQDPSMRRLLAVLLAPLFAIASSKFGIQVTEEVQESIFALIGLYLVASNAKEAAIKRAELAGQKAAEQVKTVEDATKVLKEAAK